MKTKQSIPASVPMVEMPVATLPRLAKLTAPAGVFAGWGPRLN